MDKYEYKVRSDEIKSLIAQGDYVQAAEIADTIDWRRVKSVMMLCTISDLYKINRRYEDAKNMLLLAYERRPGGRTICYSLCELCIKTEEFVQALNYYKEFVQAAPKDTGRYILQYKLYEAQEVSLEERIGVLEELKKRDYREKWAYELAYLYHRVGLGTRCVEECDELILWFGEGKYVVKAMELKMLHEPLTPVQQGLYDHRFDTYARQQSGAAEEAEPAEDYTEETGYGQTAEPEAGYEWQAAESQLPVAEGVEAPETGAEELDIQVKTMDVGRYNTINLQEELAAGLQEVLGADDVPSDGEPEEEIYAEEPEDGEEIEDTEIFFGATGEIDEMRLAEAHMAGEALAAEDGYGEYSDIPEGYEGTAGISGDYEEEPDVAGGYAEDWDRPDGFPEESGTADGSMETAIVAGGDMEAVADGGVEELSAADDQTENPGTFEGRGEDSAAVNEQAEGTAAMDGSVEETDVRDGHGQPDDTADKRTIEFHGTNSGGEEGNSMAKAVRELNVQPPKELADVLSQEANGQLSMVLPENVAIEKQITGQMKIEDILAEWEQMKRVNEEKCKQEVRQHVLRQTGPMFTEFEAAVRDGLLEQLENSEPEKAEVETAMQEQSPGEELLEFMEAEAEAEDVVIEDLEDISEADVTEMEALEDIEAEEPVAESGYVQEDVDESQELTEKGEAAGGMEYAEESEYIEETGYAEGAEYAENVEAVGDVVYIDDTEYAEGAEYAGAAEESADVWETETVEEPEYAEEAEAAIDEGYNQDAETGELEYTETLEETEAAEEPEYTSRAEAAEDSGTVEGDEPEAASEDGDITDIEENDIDIIEEIEEQLEEPKRTDMKSRSPKEAKASEKPEKPSVERDKAKVRSLTREEKELFAPFIQSRRSREQLVKAIDSISMAAYTGNVIITGEEGMDTLTLAKNIIRDVRVTDSNFSGKVAKISGKGLNDRNIVETLEQLKSGALIIEAASGMSAATATALHKSLQQERLGIIVILEDTKKAVKKLFLGAPELFGDFTARIDLEALSNDTLVSFGKQYAREMEYSIDDLGMLALHTRIEEMQTIDHVVTVTEVKQIVDEAIHRASRKTLGHFVDVLLARRYDDEDMIILTEKDFVA